MKIWLTKQKLLYLEIDQERLDTISKRFEIKTTKFNVLAANASDELRESGYDAVVSAIGPFYVFGEDSLKLAIDAGINFVDICDDYDATQK